MCFIIFDLEFNQDFSAELPLTGKLSRYPFEIIQIGALKLDSSFQEIATFNRYVKPSIYTRVSPFITELTGITTHQLLVEEPFPEVYKAFTEFIGDPEALFCIWGMSDIKEIFNSAAYHQLNTNLLPHKFINIQPYVSTYLGLPSKKLLNLQHAATALHIPQTYPFHDAFHDAYYTSELFKKIYSPIIEAKYYDPTYVAIKPRPPKKVIDVNRLLDQFEKMYSREMTEEEKEIIQLAYKMGKTHQFLKEV